MRIIVVGVPDSEFKDYILTEHVTKVRELTKTSCMVYLVDGSKYGFQKPARMLINIITGIDDETVEEFAAMAPGTDIVQ